MQSCTIFLIALSYFPISVFLPSFIVGKGGPQVLAIFNAATVLGQVVVGMLSDHISYAWILFVLGMCSSLSAFLSLGFASTLPQMYGFAILFGAFSGNCSVWSAVARDVAGASPPFTRMEVTLTREARNESSTRSPSLLVLRRRKRDGLHRRTSFGISPLRQLDRTGRGWTAGLCKVGQVRWSDGSCVGLNRDFDARVQESARGRKSWALGQMTAR